MTLIPVQLHEEITNLFGQMVQLLGYLLKKCMKLELAAVLYAQGKLSIGKARQLAGMSLWQFRQVLAARRIPPHYDIEEFNEDIETLHRLDHK